MEERSETSEGHKSSGLTFEEAIAVERAELAEAESQERAAIDAGEAKQAQGWHAQAEQCRRMIAHLEGMKVERDARDATLNFNAARAARILNALADASTDAARRELILEAAAALFHRRMSAEPRVAAWREALKA